MANKRYIWSYSKLRVFNECTEKFGFQYIDREKIEENKRVYLEGSIVQKIFEDLINQKRYKCKDFGYSSLIESIPDAFEEYIEKNYVKFKKTDTKRSIFKTLNKSAKNTFKMMQYYGFFKTDIKSEVEIRVDWESNVQLLGKLDFLSVGQKKVLFDLKCMTSRKKKFIDPRQIIFYNALLYLKYGYIADESFFYTTKDNKVIPVKVTEKKILSLLGDIKRAQIASEKPKFRKMPKDKKICWSCKFKSICWDPDLGNVKRGYLEL